MPRYIYTAKSQPNKTVQSSIEAESRQDAVNKITAMGFFPLDIESEKAHLEKQKHFLFSKIAKKTSENRHIVRYYRD